MPGVGAMVPPRLPSLHEPCQGAKELELGAGRASGPTARQSRGLIASPEEDAPAGCYTSSRMYFSLARRQKTTRKAVSGMARIIPMIPWRAVPQKKMAKMMAMGWSPV